MSPTPSRLTPPHPAVQAALPRIEDAQKALERASQALNHAQLVDALRSVRFFLELAENTLRPNPSQPS